MEMKHDLRTLQIGKLGGTLAALICNARAKSPLARLFSLMRISSGSGSGVHFSGLQLFSMSLPFDFTCLPPPSSSINWPCHTSTTNTNSFFILHLSQCLQERERQTKLRHSKHSQAMRAKRKKSKASSLDVTRSPTAFPPTGAKINPPFCHLLHRVLCLVRSSGNIQSIGSLYLKNLGPG